MPREKKTQQTSIVHLRHIYNKEPIKIEEEYIRESPINRGNSFWYKQREYKKICEEYSQDIQKIMKPSNIQNILNENNVFKSPKDSFEKYLDIRKTYSTYLKELLDISRVKTLLEPQNQDINVKAELMLYMAFETFDFNCFKRLLKLSWNREFTLTSSMANYIEWELVSSFRHYFAEQQDIFIKKYIWSECPFEIRSLVMDISDINDDYIYNFLYLYYRKRINDLITLISVKRLKEYDDLIALDKIPRDSYIDLGSINYEGDRYVIRIAESDNLDKDSQVTEYFVDINPKYSFVDAFAKLANEIQKIDDKDEFDFIKYVRSFKKIIINIERHCTYYGNPKDGENDNVFIFKNTIKTFEGFKEFCLTAKKILEECNNASQQGISKTKRGVKKKENC